MSSLEGDTAVSGKGNLINIELKYEKNLFLNENSKLNGKILGNFKGDENW